MGISIDGMDTRKLGLRELRRGLFIIPQDPVLFSASLRFNVDPFDEYSDEEVLGALKKAELGALVKSYDKGLQEVLQEGGSNLSVGQRQLGMPHSSQTGSSSPRLRSMSYQAQATLRCMSAGSWLGASS